jgi:hypothetical protein
MVLKSDKNFHACHQKIDFEALDDLIIITQSYSTFKVQQSTDNILRALLRRRGQSTSITVTRKKED